MIFDEIVNIILDILGPKVTGEEAQQIAAEVIQYIQNVLED